MKPLNYYASTDDQQETTIIVEVPQQVDAKGLLFDIYNKSLRFPDYFGWNWDAFFECMVTLPETRSKEIIIIHKDLPFESNKEDQKTYIWLLQEILLDYNKTQTKSIKIFFPSFLEEFISSIN